MNNIDLAHITTIALKEELKNREKPSLVKNPDFTDLVQLFQEHTERICQPDHISEYKDYDFAITGAALEAVFGNNIFKWISRKMYKESKE